MQFAVNQIHKLVRSFLVSFTPFREKSGDRVRVFQHIHNQAIRELFSVTAALIQRDADAAQDNAFRPEISYLIIRLGEVL
jgi:hypothetical protein